MPSAAQGKQHNGEEEATTAEASILTKSVLDIPLLEDVVAQNV